jgi:CheY-like chemotaxis protein
VTETGGATAAFEAFGDGSGFDLVLTDYAMPVMNGAELAATLRETRPGAPILLMTGFADSVALAAVWKGSVLQKPFGAQELIAAITTRLGRPREAKPKPAPRSRRRAPPPTR